jgi:muramoyltetrapeptide carboxypeptidase
MEPLIKPHPLRPGDFVAIAAPGAHLTPEGAEYLERAVTVLEGLGLRVKATPDPNRRAHYFAGGDEERAAELMELFSDPEVRAIFCTRGGYGSQRLIPFLNPQVIQENPKIFVGSSDITVLLAYLLECCHLVPFHGPNVATTQFCEGGVERTHRALKKTLSSGTPGENPLCRPLKPGVGKGPIKGGCLSLLTTTIGTAYEIDLIDAILFVEDCNEPLYRIDRMLTHLRQAGKLEHIRGLVFGEMVACRGAKGVDLKAVVLDLFRDQEIPILLGFPAGHGETNLTLPLGVEVIIDADQGRLIFNESGVSIP